MTGTTPRRRIPRERAITKVLDAAVAVFAKRGFEAATLQEIAAKLKMTAPALYYYFDSKQVLLYEVILRNLAQFKTEMDAALLMPGVAGDPPAELAAFVRVHHGFQLSKVERARVYNAMFLGTGALLDALTPRQRADIVELQAQVRRQLRGVLERGVRTGDFAIADVGVTAMAIVAMGEFAVSWYRPAGRLSAQAIADRSVELAVRMVGYSGNLPVPREPR